MTSSKVPSRRLWKRRDCDAVRDEQVVVAVVVEVHGADAARTVADHAEAERLVEERRVVAVLEGDPRRLADLGELGLVALLALPLQQGGLGDLQPSLDRLEAHAEQRPVDARARPAAGGADGLEADLGRHLSRRLPGLHPVDVQADLLDRLEAVEIGAPFVEGGPAAGAPRAPGEGGGLDAVLLPHLAEPGEAQRRALEPRAVGGFGGGEVARLEGLAEAAQGFDGAAAGVEEFAPLRVHLIEGHQGARDQDHGRQRHAQEGGFPAEPSGYRGQQSSPQRDGLGPHSNKSCGDGM